MNRLSRKERAAIIRALVEGNSLRSVTRICGHSIIWTCEEIAALLD